MDLSLRETILQKQDITIETVKIPEWGLSVNVRALTGEERDQYEKSVLVKKGKDREVNLTNARAKLVVLSVVDDEGRRVFHYEDVQALGKKSAASLSRIFDVATRLSGITEKDMEELTEELEENPFGDSPSD